MEDQFTLKEHTSLVKLLVSAAKAAEGNQVKLSLPKVAQIYGFQNLLKDDEELEFIVDDLVMELLEIDICTKDQRHIAQCGIVRADYPGDRKTLFVIIDPLLKTVGEFKLKV